MLPCPKYYLTMGASINFGSSVAVGYFDDDGSKDLAVGSPPDKVYVYFGPLDRDSAPLDPATAPSVTITNRLPNTSFGLRIASYQLPGAATAQLLVADPAAPAGSSTGKVMLFDITTLVGVSDAPYGCSGGRDPIRLPRRRRWGLVRHGPRCPDLQPAVVLAGYAGAARALGHQPPRLAHFLQLPHQRPRATKLPRRIRAASPSSRSPSGSAVIRPAPRAPAPPRSRWASRGRCRGRG